MKDELASVAPGKSPQFIQQWMDERFQQQGLRQAAMHVSRDACKNCLYAGRGLVEHSFKQCREAGHPCVLPCPRCVSAGRFQNIYHWVQDCPRA